MSSDSSDRVDPELAAMLEAERARDDLDRATRARALRRLAIAVVEPLDARAGSSPPSRSPSPSPSPSSSLSRVAVRAGAGMFVAGSVLGFAIHAAIVPAAHHEAEIAPREAIPNETTIPSASAITLPPANPAPASATSGAPDAPAPASNVPANRPNSPRASAPASSGDRSMGAERVLLETARAALVRGDSEGALEAIETHAQTFPAGRLTEEREGLRIEALVRAGRHAEARTRAEQFRRRFPNSLLLPVIDAAVQSIP